MYQEQYTGSERPNDKFVETIPPSERPPTGHKMDGFYCITGEEVNAGRVNADILDFMPTWYAALGIPIPTETDGTVIDGALDIDSDSLQRREYRFNPDYQATTGTTDDVRDRLQELGYM